MYISTHLSKLQQFAYYALVLGMELARKILLVWVHLYVAKVLLPYVIINTHTIRTAYLYRLW